MSSFPFALSTNAIAVLNVIHPAKQSEVGTLWTYRCGPPRRRVPGNPLHPERLLDPVQPCKGGIPIAAHDDVLPRILRVQNQLRFTPMLPSADGNSQMFQKVTWVTVVPFRHTAAQRCILNPYSGANSRRMWLRLNRSRYIRITDVLNVRQSHSTHDRHRHTTKTKALPAGNARV